MLIACVAAPVLAAVYLPPDPHPRFNAQAVWANGKVHWYAGYSDTVSNPLTGKTYYNNRQSGYSVFDPAANAWKSSKWSDDPQDPAGIDMNNDGICGEPEGTYPGTSQSFAYDTDNDGIEELFVHAGYPVWEGQFIRYNPVTNKWGRFGPNHWGTAQYLGVCAIDKTTGKAWAMGGGYTNNRLASYDFATDTWTDYANAPFTMVSGVGAVINGKLYVAGGNINSVANNTGIWECDLSGTPAWSAGAVANLLTGCERPAVSAYNGKLYVIGGSVGATDLTDIQVFDPVTKAVTVLGNMPVGLSRHGGVISPSGILYVGAGRQNGAYGPTKWWRTNVNVTPLVWEALPNDPSYFPYDDWNPGGEVVSGRVTGPDGKPMAMAVVGFKKTASATADAKYYARTDGMGRYSLTIAPGDYQAAAWRIGYAPSADAAFTMGANPATLDLQVTAPAGENLAPGSVIYFSGETGGEPAANAVDGNMGSRWSSGESGPEQWYIIDLGTAKSLTGVTAWWEAARPGVYAVDVTSDDPNPAGSAAWTTVYSCPKNGGGFDMGYGHFVDPIGFASVKQARGVRVRLSAFSQWWQGNYSAWDFVLHGTSPVAPPISIADARARDDGEPVELLMPVSVSGSGSTDDNPLFAPTFWVQEPDRSSGIRVVYSEPWAWPGELADIKGTMATDPVTGERYIDCTSLGAWAFTGVNFAPVAANNRSLTEGKLPVGLFVKTWGKVKEHVTGGFTISDGSTTDIKVVRQGALPAIDSMVTVTGALGAEPAIYQWPYDGYIRTWLMHGGYMAPDPGGDWQTWQQIQLETDFLESVGGEANIQPLPGDTGPNGDKWFIAELKPWEWNYNLNALPFKPTTNQKAIYAHVWILADRQYTGESGDGLELWIGSDDGYRIYWNGEQIAENNVWRAITRDEDKILNQGWTGEDIYTLEPGWNHILVKVNNYTGGFNVSVRLMANDPNGGGKVPLLLPYSVVAH